MCRPGLVLSLTTSRLCDSRPCILNDIRARVWRPRSARSLATIAAQHNQRFACHDPFYEPLLNTNSVRKLAGTNANTFGGCCSGTPLWFFWARFGCGTARRLRDSLDHLLTIAENRVRFWFSSVRAAIDQMTSDKRTYFVLNSMFTIYYM